MSMSSEPAISEGMELYGSDQTLLGRVSAIRGDHTTQTIEIEGRYLVPTTAIDHVEGDRIILPSPAALYESQLRANDEDYVQARQVFETHFTDNEGHQVSTGRIRSFDEAEANYRAGYEASRDPAFAGREFDDLEPELRTRYGSNATSDDEWSRLREELRFGWTKGRGGV